MIFRIKSKELPQHTAVDFILRVVGNDFNNFPCINILHFSFRKKLWKVLNFILVKNFNFLFTFLTLKIYVEMLKIEMVFRL